MALNRTEAQAQITSNNVPSVTNNVMGVMLNNNILDNVVFRKDLKTTASIAGLSAYTANFASSDQINLTSANQNITISFSNLEDGEVKYLSVTKTATVSISFSGAIDAVNYRNYINASVTSITYRVTSKNGTIFVEAIYSASNPTFTTINVNNTNWTGTIKYRIDEFTGKVQMEISVLANTSTGGEIAILPAAIIPDRIISLNLVAKANSATEHLSSGTFITNSGFMSASSYNVKNPNTYWAYIEYYITLP